MRALWFFALGGCGMQYVGGVESGQTGLPIAGPLVGSSLTDLWAPTVGDTPGLAHYDGLGWAVAELQASGGYAADAAGLWVAGVGLVHVAPDGTVTDRSADLPGPLGIVSLGGRDGHVVVMSAFTSGADLAFSSVEGGVVTPLLTLPGAAGTFYQDVIVNGPGDAYVVDVVGMHRLRDGALEDVALPGWDTTQSIPPITSAGPDDAWTFRVDVDEEGALTQTFYHDGGSGFVAVPIDWDYEEIGGVGTLIALPGGEAIVLSSRITEQSGGEGLGYGYTTAVNNTYEMYATRISADGDVGGTKFVYECGPNAGEPPCSVGRGNSGVLADGTLVMLGSELMWWHVPVEAL